MGSLFCYLRNLSRSHFGEPSSESTKGSVYHYFGEPSSESAKGSDVSYLRYTESLRTTLMLMVGKPGSTLQWVFLN